MFVWKLCIPNSVFLGNYPTHITLYLHRGYPAALYQHRTNTKIGRAVHQSSVLWRVIIVIDSFYYVLQRYDWDLLDVKWGYLKSAAECQLGTSGKVNSTLAAGGHGGVGMGTVFALLLFTWSGVCTGNQSTNNLLPGRRRCFCPKPLTVQWVHLQIQVIKEKTSEHLLADWLLAKRQHAIDTQTHRIKLLVQTDLAAGMQGLSLMGGLCSSK